MKKSTVTAVAFAAALAFTGGPVLANQCPKLIAANKVAIEAAEKKGVDTKKIADAKKLNEEAQTLHDTGKHAESVEAAKKAQKALES
jgi:exonuclease I